MAPSALRACPSPFCMQSVYRGVLRSRVTIRRHSKRQRAKGTYRSRTSRRIRVRHAVRRKPRDDEREAVALQRPGDALADLHARVEHGRHKHHPVGDATLRCAQEEAQDD